MRSIKRMLISIVGGALMLACSCPDVACAETPAPQAGIHKFKSSSSRMKKRKKDKNLFSKRKHFGEKKKKTTRKTTPPVMP